MTKILNVASQYIKWAPTSLAIREVSRIDALLKLDKSLKFNDKKSVLDVGCGDGRWWRYLDLVPLENVTGIDISKKEIELAKKIIEAHVEDITSNNFPNSIGKTFDFIIGNCSLEHVLEIDKALENIYKVLEDNGLFVLLVPSPLWALKGKSVDILNSISPRLAMSFSGFLNGFFQHWHLYNYKIWISMLEKKGFKVKDVYGLGNKKSEFFFRLFLVPSFISFIIKIITNKYANYYFSWILSKSLKKRFAKMIVSILDHDLVNADKDDIFEYIIVCEK